jgi:hypothetical protein
VLTELKVNSGRREQLIAQALKDVCAVMNPRPLNADLLDTAFLSVL